jgi:hypothetical protein
MPPVLLMPFEDIKERFSSFQHQQISLQRGCVVSRELNACVPKRVKLTVQGATKKKVEGRPNSWRVQGSIKLLEGHRVLWPSLQVGQCY